MPVNGWQPIGKPPTQPIGQDKELQEPGTDTSLEDGSSASC